jgi:hypothetical protein
VAEGAPVEPHASRSYPQPLTSLSLHTSADRSRLARPATPAALVLRSGGARVDLYRLVRDSDAEALCQGPRAGQDPWILPDIQEARAGLGGSDGVEEGAGEWTRAEYVSRVL